MGQSRKQEMSMQAEGTSSTDDEDRYRQYVKK
jgi:hypothetical protein